MKVKMKEHNGVVALVVTGAGQEIIITEEDGCLAVEMVNTVPAPMPVCIKEEMRTANVLPLVLDDDMQEEEQDEWQDSAQPALGNDGLFNKLVLLRKKFAIADKVPPFMVFHNKTLHEMVDKMPPDMLSMGCISGVGQAKLEKYGPAFLEAINGVAVAV